MKPEKKKLKLQKGKSTFAFYEDDDETLYKIFESIWDIVIFKEMERCKQSYDIIYMDIIRALNNPEHTTFMLNLGRRMRLYLINDIQNDEN